jgi:hypothetical protein
MSSKLANLFCLVIAAAAFAMIGLDATAHHGTTHSGAQQRIEVRK